MRNARSLWRAVLKTMRLLAFVLAALSSAASGYCDAPSFSEVTDALFGDVPLSQLIDAEQNVLFEDAGTIIVFHGGGCAKSERAGKQQTLKVEQSIDVPSYAKNATVFLNGWRLQYLQGDHHVGFIVTAIRNVRLEGQTLKWEAIGKLADRNFDDAYLWCYRFTAFGWDPSRINVSVDDRDDPAETDNITFQNFFAGQNLTDSAPPDSAGVAFPRFVASAVSSGSKPVAVLPRGFMFGWNDDHHLLQMAYNLDHSEPFIDASRKYFNRGKDQLPQLNTSQVVSSFSSWETTVIFKDDDGRRDYAFGEVVSILGGDDMGLIQPPFSSEVVRPISGAGVSEGGVKTESFVIENIPFQYAIPVLTGWELRYEPPEDQHVKEMGVSIEIPLENGAYYEVDPQTQRGRLRYKLSSVLQDRDSRPAFFSRHRVTVVGLRPIGGGRPIPITK
jgi:hypothetical protein